MAQILITLFLVKFGNIVYFLRQEGNARGG